MRAATTHTTTHTRADPRLSGALARWWQRRETEVALARLNDRSLADIGFAREDIPLVARGIHPAGQEPNATGWRRHLAGVLESLRASRERHRERARIRAELEAYDDRELDDLGVRRRDIPGLVRGAQPAH